jgi:membrane associated rhomboid family serine protease
MDLWGGMRSSSRRFFINFSSIGKNNFLTFIYIGAVKSAPHPTFFLTLGATDVGGTAFWAHIGGFVFGAFIALFFRKKTRTRQIPQW